MNVQEVIKFQVMSNMTRPAADKQHTMYDVFIQVVLMFFMGIIEDLCKAMPRIVENIKKRWSGHLHKRIQEALPLQDESLASKSILLDKRHNINTVQMMRVYSQQKSSGSSSSSIDSANMAEMNHRVDAILSHVAHLDNIPTMQLIPNGHFMVSYQDKPFQITKDLYMKIDEIKRDEKTGSIIDITVCLMSNNMSASDISRYVDNLYAIYKEELKNSLGKNIYFFDQKFKDMAPPRAPVDTSGDNVLAHRRMLIQSAPKQLNFTMTPFYSNKRFNNIFGTDVRKVQQRIEFFLNNRDWYDQKGIPYQIGVMLSGLPGTGKTSIIRAIANMTKRHIINVNFANITTATQLKNLFYNERLEVYTDCTFSDTKSFYIPIDQRLYILEEIDAVSDILKQRDDSKKQETVIADQLTLGEILTVLDGTMEIPGRMIIMTSNHPEFLDKALLRPGRIDVNAKFGNATSELVAEMIEEYLDINFPHDRINELPNDLLTPAEASEVIMRYCKADDISIDQIIRELNVATSTGHIVPTKVDNMVTPINTEEPTVKTPQISDVALDTPKLSDTETEAISLLLPTVLRHKKELTVKLMKSMKDKPNLIDKLQQSLYKVDFCSLCSKFPATMEALINIYLDDGVTEGTIKEFNNLVDMLAAIPYEDGIDSKIRTDFYRLGNIYQVSTALNMYKKTENSLPPFFQEEEFASKLSELVQGLQKQKPELLPKLHASLGKINSRIVLNYPGTLKAIVRIYLNTPIESFIHDIRAEDTIIAKFTESIDILETIPKTVDLDSKICTSVCNLSSITLVPMALKMYQNTAAVNKDPFMASDSYGGSSYSFI